MVQFGDVTTAAGIQRPGVSITILFFLGHFTANPPLSSPAEFDFAPTILRPYNLIHEAFFYFLFQQRRNRNIFCHFKNPPTRNVTA